MIKEPLSKELLKESRNLIVSEYKRGEDKNYTVAFETGATALFDEEEFFKYDLYNTDEPIRLTLGELAFEINRRRCFLVGVCLLSASLKPSGFVEQNMKACGFSDDDIEYARTKLIEEEYLNDERYAEKYALKKISGGKSSAKIIKLELVAKGVPEDIADSAIKNMAIDDLATAEKIVEKKRKIGDDDAKIMRFLAGKGFETGIIYKAINNEQE